jgi:hypothetical protein
MRGFLRRLFACFGVITVLFSIPSHASADEKIIERNEGIASNESGSELFKETHWIAGSAPHRKMLILFRCLDGNAFARKQMSEDGRPFAPDFDFEDERMGYREGVRTRGGLSREIYVQRRSDGPEQSASLDAGAGLVIDGGIDAVIKTHWDDIVGGKVRSMPFVVPSRLRTYSFRVRRVANASATAPTQYRFRLELDSWFAFALSSIDMIYDATTRTVLAIEGISNVRQSSGRPFPVHIRFPPNLRSKVTSADWEKAEREPLNGRCDF